ncbi:MAG: chromate transporter, partial [Burkholderiales bacterium]
MNDSAVVSFKQAFWFWLKLGFISFGGPAGQIAIMHKELVEQKRWISESRFLHALNYCMLLPGPEAQQLATYLGWSMHGVRGGLVAGGLFVLPSLLILTGLSWAYLSFGQTATAAGILYGMKAAVVAVVMHAVWRVGKRTLRHPVLMLIALFAFIALFFLHLPFPLIVAMAAIL